MPDDVKDAIEGVMTAFNQFKEANDENLKKRDVVLEEKLNKINATLDEFEGINKKVTLAEKSAAAVTELQDHIDRIEARVNRPGGGGGESREAVEKRLDLWARGAIAVQCQGLGVANLRDGQRAALDRVREHYAAMSVADDTTGGYLAPPELVRDIIKGVTEISPVRAICRVRTTANKSIMQPKRVGRASARRVSERGTRTDTGNPSWGMVEINAPEMYARISISRQNLEDSAYDLVGEIREDATEQFEVLEGNEWVSGDGVDSYEGILSNTGVETTNSGAATTVTADGLLTLKYGVKTAYARNGTFTLNRSTLGSVRRLKDGNGQYLWMPGIAAGRPNTIDGDPYVEFPDMPSEGAGLKPVAYGDFRRAYTVVDRLAMNMQRDPFTEADSGGIVFRFYRRSGGRVVLSEAIRTLTCAV